ncbi:hypothetical protein [Rhodoferax sp.]|uniref:hypothetical protein n=1 Tax=Rhodoferax sp. TaxID=50421 RepID=UPI00275D23EF|nr:hypothetical protein [Rhodoferax sp.]
MFTDAITGPDARASLLAEVEFKWLMAGHGWWIDMARFHRDPVYATELLDLALASQSSALRDCAAVLRSRAGLTTRRAA